MSVKEDLEKLLIKWLKKNKGIDAVEASLGTDTDKGDEGGCDTCGYGSDPMSFTIEYRTEAMKYRTYDNIFRDPLEFLAELLAFEE